LKLASATASTTANAAVNQNKASRAAVVSHGGIVSLASRRLTFFA
jgi:hypothetical protein